MNENIQSLIFSVSMIGCVVWSAVCLLFGGDYFVSTLSESAIGEDEVRYPPETMVERIWKPALCVWILAFWVFVGGIALAPCLSPFAEVLGVVLAVLVWFVYPLSVLSVLSSQHWVYFLYPPIVWRLLRQCQGIIYVYCITFLFAAACAAFLVGVFGHSFLWALPASFALPTALLLYARHWGRLAWWVLNSEPKKRKRRRRARLMEEVDEEDDVPEMDVEVVNVAEAIREGLPPVLPRAFAEGVPMAIPAGVPVHSPTPTAPQEEEEDEWSTNKQPYKVLESEPPTAVPEAVPAYARETSDADKPIQLAQYYEEAAKKEQQRQEEIEAAARPLSPRSSNKTPTFHTTLIWGTWVFMIYANTLRVWVMLVGLTIVELFFLFMVVRFWPQAPG